MITSNETLLEYLIDAYDENIQTMLLELYLWRQGLWARIIFIKNKWIYLGNLDGVKYVGFICPEHDFKVSHNHGRPDKLKVWCNECKAYHRYGSWKHGKT